MEATENSNSAPVKIKSSPQTPITDIFNRFKFKNNEFIRAMDKLDVLVDACEITIADIEYLKKVDFQYEMIRLGHKDFHAQGAELQKSILENTLKEAFERSMLFFEDTDPEKLNTDLNHYKIKFLQKGMETEFMLDYLSRLEMNLNRFRTEYQMQVFFEYPIDLSSMFNIQRIMMEAQNEPDLRARKQIFVDAMTECELFCLGLTLKPVEESNYHDIILKCREAIGVIDFQIKHTPSVDKAEQIDPPALPPATSRFRLASKKKTDFIKIVSAMYDARMFETEDGFITSSKQELLNEFGRIVGEEFGTYSVLLSKAKAVEKDVFMKPFKEIEKKGEEYYHKDYDK